MSKVVMFLVSLILFALIAKSTPPAKEFYQIRIYHLKSSRQQTIVEDFLQHAYLPALHRIGMKAGVFKPVVKDENMVDTARLIYVFLPFRSYDDFSKLDQKLAKDKQYLLNGKVYLDASYTDAPYDRIETILLKAFDRHPDFTAPVLSSEHKDRIYELRSYEGFTEKISANKIDMFNKGDEIGLFKRLGFNAVFYAEVVAGSRMPNLMYLTTFENQAARDAHWDVFKNDPYWKKLSAMPEYQHNVSKNVTTFLYPADYSDL